MTKSAYLKRHRQIRTKSPHKKCAIRYDKLYIDNTPYVYDEEKSQVVRYVPPESQRPLSRNNYSRMDESYYGGSAGLVRSTSVPSVNGGGGEGAGVGISAVGSDTDSLDSRSGGGGGKMSTWGETLFQNSLHNLLQAPATIFQPKCSYQAFF